MCIIDYRNGNGQLGKDWRPSPLTAENIAHKLRICQHLGWTVDRKEQAYALFTNPDGGWKLLFHGEPGYEFFTVRTDATEAEVLEIAEAMLATVAKAGAA